MNERNMLNKLTRTALVIGCVGAACVGGLANADDASIKIGVLTDMSSVYADGAGKGSVEAAQLAIEDAGDVLGKPVELVSADHQNKPDLGTAVARQWYDRDGVDMITDVPGSPAVLAV